MSNSIKRQKRAKQKAKMSRIQKQHLLEIKNLYRDFSSFSPEVLMLFIDLAEYDESLDSLIPKLKSFVILNQQKPDELVADTAMLFSIYMWWKHNLDDPIYVPIVSSLSEQLMHQPEFLKYFD